MLDYSLVFSDAQAETTQAAHVSDNVVDCGVADANLGAGLPAYIVATVNTLFASGGAATLDVAVHDSADNSTFTELLGVLQFALGSLTQGAELMKIALPPSHLRYIRLVYTIGTADMTAGAIDAYISLDPSHALA